MQKVFLGSVNLELVEEGVLRLAVFNSLALNFLGLDFLMLNSWL